jgi:hypothetical protein
MEYCFCEFGGHIKHAPNHWCRVPKELTEMFRRQTRIAMGNLKKRLHANLLTVTYQVKQTLEYVHYYGCGEIMQQWYRTVGNRMVKRERTLYYDERGNDFDDLWQWGVTSHLFPNRQRGFEGWGFYTSTANKPLILSNAQWWQKK